MIHDFDRRYWIGGSDIDQYVMANNHNTKAWQRWWAEKCGLSDGGGYFTTAMRTGSMLEHSILKTWDENITWDGQIIYKPLMLRVNYDGWDDGVIYEVKCHRQNNSWTWDRYRGQLITQAWTYEKMADELGLPPFREIHVLEYAFTPEEENTVYDAATVEEGGIELDRKRIKDIAIPYKSRQFKGIKSHLKPLAKDLKRLLPEERS